MAPLSNKSFRNLQIAANLQSAQCLNRTQDEMTDFITVRSLRCPTANIRGEKAIKALLQKREMIRMYVDETLRL